MGHVSEEDIFACVIAYTWRRTEYTTPKCAPFAGLPWVESHWEEMTEEKSPHPLLAKVAYGLLLQGFQSFLSFHGSLTLLLDEDVVNLGFLYELTLF